MSDGIIIRVLSECSVGGGGGFVRKLSPDGRTLTTIAGSGACVLASPGGPDAAVLPLCAATAIAAASDDVLYVAESGAWGETNITNPRVTSAKWASGLLQAPIESGDSGGRWLAPIRHLRPRCGRLTPLQVALHSARKCSYPSAYVINTMTALAQVCGRRASDGCGATPAGYRRGRYCG